MLLVLEILHVLALRVLTFSYQNAVLLPVSCIFLALNLNVWQLKIRPTCLLNVVYVKICWFLLEQSCTWSIWVKSFSPVVQAAELEIEAYPLLDELTSKISTLNLERVRRLKSRLVALTRRVQKVSYCITIYMLLSTFRSSFEALSNWHYVFQ